MTRSSVETLAGGEAGEAALPFWVSAEVSSQGGEGVQVAWVEFIPSGVADGVVFLDKEARRY